MTIYGTDKNLFVNGDKARYTGSSEIVHGQEAYEIEVTEGHKKGQLLWTYRKPGQLTAVLH